MKVGTNYTEKSYVHTVMKKLVVLRRWDSKKARLPVNLRYWTKIKISDTKDFDDRMNAKIP